jgi:hypothetical protein
MKPFLVFISVFAGNYIFAQNVGIGTNSPQFPLSFPGTVGDKISLWSDGSSTHYGLGIQSNLFQIFTKTNNNDIVFGYGSSGAFTETMRIKGNGNVGIGTTTPAATLDVNGQVKISGGSPGDGKVLVSDANGIASWSNSSINTGAFAYSSGGTPQLIPTSTSIVMAFPAIFVAGNNYSTVDNSYTCPTAGFYHFDMQLTFRTINPYAGDKQLVIGLYVNGGSVWSPPYLLRSSAVDDTFQFSFSTPLGAGDKVTFHITQNTGFNQQLLAGYFQGYRVY